MAATHPSIPVVPVQDLWNPTHLENLKRLCVPCSDVQQGDILALCFEMETIILGLGSTRAQLVPSGNPDTCVVRSASGLSLMPRDQVPAPRAEDEDAFYYALSLCHNEAYTDNAAAIGQATLRRPRYTSNRTSFSLYRAPEGVISIMTAANQGKWELYPWVDDLPRTEAVGALITIHVPKAASAHGRLTQQPLIEPEGNLAALSRMLLEHHHPELPWLHHAPLRFIDTT